jgi:pSer/pThr/pTyr-binding forkhead associated (FHA) protein
MALTVVVRSGDTQSPPAITFDAPRIVIGRGEGCEVRLPDPSISHRHASIRQRGTDYIVLDEGSTNGTFVGPVRLSPQAPRMLKSGDLIRVGRIWLEVRIEQVMPTQNPSQATSEIALGLVADALSAQGEPAAPKVVVAEGPDAGRELVLSAAGKSYVIGRGKTVDFPLADVDASRRHVEVFRRGDHVMVRDLGSKNGSRLGDEPLPPSKERVWPEGQSVFLGQNRLVFEDPVGEALEELERAADEHMQEDDSVDPPRSEGASDAAQAPEPVAGQRGGAPIAEVPRATVRPRPTKRGWSSTDVAVALLALLVLGLSLVGLVWLFGSE